MQLIYRTDLPLMKSMLLATVGLIATSFLIGCNPNGSSGTDANTLTLLNVSYDPTREFYVEFNDAFAQDWKEKHGQQLLIDQSHGASGKQARAVVEGLSADIVSLALAGDIDLIAKNGKLLESDWQTRLPHNSSPYTSTIVFLVRKGNPKKIQDWDDLIREGVEVINPNPKTSGGARWNYLAAWGYILHRELGDFGALRDPGRAEEVAKATEKAREFIRELFTHIPVLDTGARGATNTFLQRKIGDVLITWENEAFLALKELGKEEVEIIVPSLSILAEPPVAVITKNSDKRGTTEAAQAYLEFLYSDQGQQIAAKHFYRPRNRDVVDRESLEKFSDLNLFQLTDIVSGWDEAQEIHFKDRTGIFDQVFKP